VVLNAELLRVSVKEGGLAHGGLWGVPLGRKQVLKHREGPLRGRFLQSLEKVGTQSYVNSDYGRCLYHK
jgi:hypothetical protein